MIVRSDDSANAPAWAGCQKREPKADSMSMTDIPTPYDATDLVPEFVEPERKDEYTVCPECGVEAFDGIMRFCSDCDYYEEPEISESDRVRVMEEIRKAQARIEARRGLCEEFRCSNFAVVRCTYPIHDDYKGKYLGDEAVDLCVPCFKDRHDESGRCHVRNMQPSKIEPYTPKV